MSGGVSQLDGDIIFETTPHPMMVFDGQTLAILRVNQAAIDTYGYSREEFLGLTVKDLKPAEDLPALYDIIAKSETGTSRPGVWQHIAKDGRTLWMDITGYQIDLDGRPVRLALLHNVTNLIGLERERVELLGREKEARLRAETEADSFRALFESVPGKFLVIRASDFEIFSASDAYLSAAGRNRDDLVGRNLFEAFGEHADMPESEAARAMRMSLERVRQTGSTDIMPLLHYPAPQASGDSAGAPERWWHVVNTPVTTGPGQVSYIIHRVNDVTSYVSGEPAGADIQPDTGGAGALPAYHELAQATRRMREQEASMRTAQQLLGIGVWRYHAASRTLIWSDEVHAIYGTDPAKPVMTAHDHVQAMHPDDLAALTPRYEAFLASQERAFEFEYRVTRPDGQLVHVRGNAERTGEPGNEVMTGVVQDITAHKRFEAELMEARDAAERANRLKSEFLANMSHEIRTPLNGVLGMSQILARTPLDERQKRMVDTVLSSGKALLSILDDILNISKIEAGLFVLEPEPVVLACMCERAVDAVRAGAMEKGLAIACHVSPRLPRQIIADHRRIGQVLINLLGNAVKFTDAGGVRLDVEPAADGWMRYTVSDTGPGIPADRLDMIFDRFRQVDASHARRHDGAGLGLAICKEFTALMGGQIRVDSTPGEGSRFIVELPLVPAGAEAPASEAAQGPATPLPRRLLVAEDNLVNLQTLVLMLEELGLPAPVCVDNGEAAVKAALTGEFDAIIMDISMPVMNGIDAIEAIRALPAPAAHTPILALTALAEIHDRDACLAAGADGFISKPVDLDGLRQALARLREPSARTPRENAMTR